MTTSTADPHTAADSSGIEDLRALVEPVLHRTFTAEETDALRPFADAVQYSLLAPGKRIRPVLTLASAEACGAPARLAVNVGAAFELIHAYSLVHDDLPAMDDDDLRRGRPTSHRRFGEDVAILVGDALQARAFELIALDTAVPERRRVAAVALLARCAGWRGMVGGQFLDVDAARTDSSDHAALREVHERKTAALLGGAVAAGAAVAGADAEVQDQFERFGRELGWLFQLVDDLLDATGSVEALGKTPGKDARSGKVTAVDAFGGVAQLRAAADEQLELCVRRAGELPAGGGRLVGIARYVHGRDR